MKKLLFLSAIVTLLSAEEPLDDSLNLVSLAKKVEEQPTANSEELAKNEIESFFDLEESPLEFSEPMALQPAQETGNQDVASPAAKELPNLAPQEKLTLIKNDSIELKAEAPPIVEKSLEVSPIAPQIVKQESIENISMTDADMAALEAEVNGGNEKGTGVMIDLSQVFAGSPTIYTLLVLLSVGSFGVWLYTLFSLRTHELMPVEQVKNVREKLVSHDYEAALAICKESKSLLFQMVASGITSRHHGQTVMVDTMKSEGRRGSAGFWQKIALLNDIAMIAPMLGLLGTVLGMFYAFYDLNRSMESISALFDGLGISVGTTVCGLIVAILAMMFHAMTKYRLMRQLTLIENEAQVLANLIDTKESS